MLVQKLLSVAFGIFEPQVKVGLIARADPKKSHGNVWVEGEKGPVMHNLVVDKPRHLKKHNADIVEMIFEQVENLGFVPQHLEIKTRREHRVYRSGQPKPIFVQRLH